MAMTKALISVNCSTLFMKYIEVMIHDSHGFDRYLEDVNIPMTKLPSMRTLEIYQETQIHPHAPGRKHRAGVVYCP